MPTTLQCWLTHRSTGPIAACRHLGYKSLAQMPTRRNGPVSSNVSHHRIPQLTQLSSFLVTHISGLRNSAKLRRRLEVSSWLALRAVAHCASSVHSVAAQGASWRDASTLLNLEAKSSKFAAGGEHLNLKSVPRLSKVDDGCRHGKAQLQQLVELNR